MKIAHIHISASPDVLQVIILFCSIFLFWNIENLLAINFNYTKWKHAMTNGLFVFTAIPVQLILGLVLAFTVNWTSIHQFGILNWIPGLSHSWLAFPAALILLDFFEYVYHVIMHKVKKFWMFHLVHHSDNVVDVSTTLREHPGETAIRLSFSVLWVFISGVGFWIVLIRQLIQIFANVFAHSNFRIPEKIDRVVGAVFITPNLHHVHHHFKQPYTDSNYGDILSVWDRVFGTFKRLEVDKVVFGIDSCMDSSENGDFKKLVKLPFEQYRPPS